MRPRLIHNLVTIEGGEKERTDEERRADEVKKVVLLMHRQTVPRSATWVAGELGIDVERVAEILETMEGEGDVKSRAYGERFAVVGEGPEGKEDDHGTE